MTIKSALIYTNIPTRRSETLTCWWWTAVMHRKVKRHGCWRVTYRDCASSWSVLAADPCYRHLQLFATGLRCLRARYFTTSTRQFCTLESDVVQICSARNLHTSTLHGCAICAIDPRYLHHRSSSLPSTPLRPPPRGYYQNEELVTWPSSAGAVMYVDQCIGSPSGECRHPI